MDTKEERTIDHKLVSTGIARDMAAGAINEAIKVPSYILDQLFRQKAEALRSVYEGCRLADEFFRRDNSKAYKVGTWITDGAYIVMGAAAGNELVQTILKYTA